MPHVQNIVTLKRLTQDLQSLGVQKGDLLYIHSSLKSVGWLENGPETLIHALLTVLGEEGTFAVPTHTLSFPGRGVPPMTRKLPPAFWEHSPKL